MLRAAREAARPGVVIAGGSDVLLLTEDAARRRAIERVLRDADAILTVGERLRGRVIELGAPAARVTAFQRGVDTSVFNPGDRSAARTRLGVPASRPVALWVGRMVAVKGLDGLLEAWASSLGSGRRALPGGRGPAASRLSKRALDSSAWAAEWSSSGPSRNHGSRTGTGPLTSQSFQACPRASRTCCSRAWPAARRSSRPRWVASPRSRATRAACGCRRTTGQRSLARSSVGWNRPREWLAVRGLDRGIGGHADASARGGRGRSAARPGSSVCSLGWPRASLKRRFPLACRDCTLDL